jgi:hypothetical protein
MSTQSCSNTHILGKRVKDPVYIEDTAEVKAETALNSGVESTVDEFGLPARRLSRESRCGSMSDESRKEDGNEEQTQPIERPQSPDSFQSAESGHSRLPSHPEGSHSEQKGDRHEKQEDEPSTDLKGTPVNHENRPGEPAQINSTLQDDGNDVREHVNEGLSSPQSPDRARPRTGTLTKIHNGPPVNMTGISQWSHQVLVSGNIRAEEEEGEHEWQDMTAYGRYDLYDDEGKLVAKGTRDFDDLNDADEGRGGAGKGYTRVQIDEDAKSTTSMDENTGYLFKEKGTNVVDEDEDSRDPLAQMQATKDMLTEGQRIAYVGVTRLAMTQMIQELEEMQAMKDLKKELAVATESMRMWGQKTMVRLYAHMDIDSSGIMFPHPKKKDEMLISYRADNDRTTSRTWCPTFGLDSHSHEKFSSQKPYGTSNSYKP